MENQTNIKEKIKAIDIISALKKTVLQERKPIEDYMRNAAKNNGIWISLLTKQLDLNLTLQEKSLLYLMHTLFVTEDQLGGLMNFTIYALMTNRHDDIWNQNTQKFASTFKDLLGLPLSAKMQFLEKHGFGFLCEVCPKKIRNAIAHFNFTIEEDGTVQIPTETYSPDELIGIIRKTQNIIQIITDLWSEELRNN